MKSFFKILFVVSILALAASCSREKISPRAKNVKATVMVSVPPYAYIVKRIAGETVNVQTIVPAGSNPHIFEPKPSNLNSLHNLKFLVLIGENFETKIKDILSYRFPSLKQLDLSSDATIEETKPCSHHGKHKHSHTSKDLHFWLSPKIMQKQAEKISSDLCLLFPENRDLYENNLNALVEDLEKTDLTIQGALAAKKDSSILVSHPAFAYFCEAYDLHQLSIEVDGKEPLPRDVSKLLEKVKEASISFILTQPQHSNKGAEAIGKELSLPLIEVDPYSENYLENMMHLASMLSKDNS